jgi:hypothetical protein
MFLIILSIIIQAFFLIILIRRLKIKFLSSLIGIFSGVAFGYHGLTEILQIIFPEANRYRSLVELRFLSLYVVLFTIAFALCIVTYLYFHKRGGALTNLKTALLSTFRANCPSLFIVLILCLLSVASNVRMIDFAPQTELLFSAAFGWNLLYFIPLATVIVTIRYGKVAFFVAIILQIAALFLIAQRVTAVATIGLTLGLLNLLGLRLGRKAIIGVCVMAAFIIFLIPLMRTFGAEGILIKDLSMSDRALALSKGLNPFSQSAPADVLIDTFVYRFDGNTFSSIVFEKISNKKIPLPYGITFLGNLKLLIPRIFYPGKPTDDTLLFADISEELFLVLYYMLPVSLDFTPTQSGIIFANFGSLGLVIYCIILGYVLAKIDRKISGRPNIFNICLFLYLGQCFYFYEQGFAIIAIQFRQFLIVYFILSVCRRFRISILMRRPA